jgi:NO-binding membrane sensor protein with MHYT domain
MFLDFFQLSPLPNNQIIGTYNLSLVILSYLVATFASYIALDLAGRLRDISKTPFNSNLLLCGGAL